MSEPRTVRSDKLTVYSAGSTASLSDFRGRKVQQLLVVVFKEGFSRQEWKTIFLKTNQLTRFRSEITRMNAALEESGARTEAEQTRYLELVSQTAELLLEIYENYAAYLLVVTEDQQCAFTVEDQPTLKCGTDLPVSVTPLRMDKIKNEQTPSASFNMSSVGKTEGTFALNLRLKPEVTDIERYFSGNIIVEPGSSFLKEGTPAAHYTYGFVELRLDSVGSK